MATTDETLRLAGELRIVLDAHVDQATRDLVAAWARTWQTLTIDWAAAYRPIIEANRDGVAPTRGQILRAARTQEALAVTRRALGDLAEQSRIRLLQPIDPIVAQAYGAQDAIVWSQLPPGDAAASVRALVLRVDQRQLEAIVRRTTERVTSLAAALQPAGMEIVNAELVRGVALGLNPRVVARETVAGVRFLNGMRQAFNLPLHRAMIIARTELLDAHRSAAGLGQSEHADILKGWMWLAKLDTRTCPSCWSQHGTIHDLDESGPDDHQQGRCARLPVTKSWKDLGLDVIEPPPLVPDAQATFAKLSRADKLAVMGPDRLRALDTGALGWGDLSVVRRTPHWRDSLGPIPARAARRAADQVA